MAESILRARLGEGGVAARVASAGLMSGGAPPTAPAVSVMADVGLDISAHLSVQVTRELLDAADLIVTMTRQHVIELALLDPPALARTFQVRDLLRRAEASGPRGAQELRAWLNLLGSDRTRQNILQSSLSDDVADPIGQPAGVYKRTRDELDDLMTRLAALL